jgi:hypothetical protein
MRSFMRPFYSVLNSRIIVWVLAVWILAIATPAFSSANLASASKTTSMTNREVVDDLDPKGTLDCASLGELDISFRTDNDDPRDVGLVLTDPRGRRVGFDVLTQRAWDELPVAQGDIDCDALDGANSCEGLVQICGPVSGTYKLEVIAQRSTAYSLNISARSRQVYGDHGSKFSQSDAPVNNVAIRGGSRDIVVIDYSRDPQQRVAAQLQSSLHARR